MIIRYVFNTAGNYVAFVSGGYLFDPDGKYLGFIVHGNEVYAPDGKFLGYLQSDDRVVRNKTEPPRRYQGLLPPPPIPPLKPLPPLQRLRMIPLPYPIEDVFENRHIVPSRLVPVYSVSNLNVLEGAKLFASDGVYLGTVSKNKFDSESISNTVGTYGSPFQPLSIFNHVGNYGSPYSPLSPTSPYSSSPPIVVKDGRNYGHLTVNKYLSHRIDWEPFLTWLGRR